MLNVLIVDDDRNLCDCLFGLMPWAELNCNPPLIAYNGQEAWELLQKEKIDFVLCDLKMPVMGGVDLCRRIREKMPDVEMVFLSAYEDFETARLALQYGISDYVLKPVNRECLNHLEGLVRKAAGKKETRDIGRRLLQGEYHKPITEALGNGDRRFLEGIFSQIKKLDEAGTFNSLICLLRILQEYLIVIHGKADVAVCHSLYKKWCSEVVRQTDTEERVEYVRSLYEKEVGGKEQETENNQLRQLACRIGQLVEEHYMQRDCNVAYLAEKMDMTAGYIGRIFGKYSGISLVEYITECRLKQAKQLLSSDDCAVNEVAQKVGYTDSNYFTKVFKDRIGMSPSEYRKKSRRDKLEKTAGMDQSQS